MKTPITAWVTGVALLGLALASSSVRAQEPPGGGPPAPPTNLRVKNMSNYARTALRVRWDHGAPEGRNGYEVYRATSGDGEEFVLLATLPPVIAEYLDVIDVTAKSTIEKLREVRGEFTTLDRNGDGALREYRGQPLDADEDGIVTRVEMETLDRQLEEKKEQDEIPDHLSATLVAADADADLRVTTAEIDARIEALTIDPKLTYTYHLRAIGAGGKSAPTANTAPMSAERGTIGEFHWSTATLYDWGRRWFMIVTIVICLAVIYYILQARAGKTLKVRKIAGLEAVDEAVGRATEMGRSCLFIPGIQDMNEIQTIAGITVLARVAKTAAEFDAKVEVPTARSLVMTTARETVQAAYLSAGRPDAYNQDLIYYVTDEQFGYVAYLSGMMVREKPAACFYMGAFFAESLILAETGNSIGAIQVAGTAMPAQLPFFVAACDYTLIGEEFFAASAYLSGSPEELGSLKGQDIGKVMVAVILVVGCLFATFAAIGDTDALHDAVEFITQTLLT